MDIDFQLAKQMSQLQASEKEGMLNDLQDKVGKNVSRSFIKYCLDVSNWNFDQALSAYFDISADATPFEKNSSKALCCNWINCSFYQDFEFSWYDASLVHSPNSSFFTKEMTHNLCLRNSGIKSWPDGCYLKSQKSGFAAPLASKNESEKTLWLPLGHFNTPKLPSLSPGQHINLSLTIETPAFDDCYRYFQTNAFLIGAVNLTLPTDEIFGDIIYFTLVKDPNSNSILSCPGCQNDTASRPSTSQNIVCDSNQMD